jgi:dipeptidyl-peptidase 4
VRSVDESFPHQYARTRRYTCGEPRSLQAAGDRLFFLRSASGDDPVNALWMIEFADPATETLTLPEEVLLCDPPSVLAADDQAELPAAERARRERLRESAGGITAYSIDTNGTVCSFTLAGQLFVVDVATRTTRAYQVGEGAYEARISPDGSSVAYLSDGTLRVIGPLRQVDDGGERDPGDVTDSDVADSDVAEADVAADVAVDRLIAGDHDPDITWGAADFIASEEFDRFRGFWWSPDSSRILAERVDNTPVQEWWISDPAHPERRPVSHRYPAAGTENALLSLAIWKIIGDPLCEPIDLGFDLDEDRPYLVHAQWHDEGIIIVTLDRDQTDQRTYLFDPAAPVPMFAEQYDAAWVELTPGCPRPTSPTSFFSTQTSSDDSDDLGTTNLVGWASDQPTHKITNDSPATPEDALDEVAATEWISTLSARPNLQIRALISATSTHVLISATASDVVNGLDLAVGPENLSVIKLSTDGSEQDQVIAGGSAEPGQHSVAAHSEHITVVRSATIDRPGAVCRIFRDGKELGALRSLAELPVVTPVPTFIRAGVRQLPVAVFLPTDPLLREPGVSLPVVMDPYAGPHAQRVVASHNAHLSSQWLADQGFAVVVVDGRGTPGLGPLFEQGVYRDLAGPVLADQVVGLLEAAALFPQLDLSRVGIKGWSFGGYLAALAVLRRPDVFHCAVAGAPVTDWALYDTAYTERYLGNPIEDDEPYVRTSLINMAPQLSRPLMLIHGLADDNVVAAHTLQFSNALLTAGKAHEFLPLVGVTHMTPQPAVAENLQMLQLDFLRRHLGVPRV